VIYCDLSWLHEGGGPPRLFAMSTRVMAMVDSIVGLSVDSLGDRLIGMCAHRKTFRKPRSRWPLLYDHGILDCWLYLRYHGCGWRAVTASSIVLLFILIVWVAGYTLRYHGCGWRAVTTNCIVLLLILIVWVAGYTSRYHGCGWHAVTAS